MPAMRRYSSVGLIKTALWKGGFDLSLPHRIWKLWATHDENIRRWVWIKTHTHRELSSCCFYWPCRWWLDTTDVAEEHTPQSPPHQERPQDKPTHQWQISPAGPTRPCCHPASVPPSGQRRGKWSEWWRSLTVPSPPAQLCSEGNKGVSWRWIWGWTAMGLYHREQLQPGASAI